MNTYGPKQDERNLVENDACLMHEECARVTLHKEALKDRRSPQNEARVGSTTVDGFVTVQAHFDPKSLELAPEPPDKTRLKNATVLYMRS